MPFRPSRPCSKMRRLGGRFGGRQSERRQCGVSDDEESRLDCPTKISGAHFAKCALPSLIPWSFFTPCALPPSLAAQPTGPASVQRRPRRPLPNKGSAHALRTHAVQLPKMAPQGPCGEPRGAFALRKGLLLLLQRAENLKPPRMGESGG